MVDVKLKYTDSPLEYICTNIGGCLWSDHFNHLYAQTIYQANKRLALPAGYTPTCLKNHCSVVLDRIQYVPHEIRCEIHRTNGHIITANKNSTATISIQHWFTR